MSAVQDDIGPAIRLSEAQISDLARRVKFEAMIAADSAVGGRCGNSQRAVAQLRKIKALVEGL